MANARSHWPLSLLGGATSVLNLVLPLVLVRLLPAEQIGTYKIFFLYLVLVPWLLMTAGLLNGLSHWAGKSTTKRLEAFRLTWTLLVIAAGTVTILALGLSPWLARLLDWPARQMVVFALCTFFTIAATFYEEASVALGEIWRGAIFNSGFEFLKNLSVLLAAVVYRDVEAVFIAYAALMAVKTGLGVALGRRAGFQKLTAVLGASLRTDLLRYALPVSLSALFQVVTNYIDQLTLSKYISPSDFAVYSLGCMMIPPLMIFEQSVNRVLIPGLSASFEEKNAAGAQTAYRKAVREIAWLTLPSVFGLILYARPIVLMLFTSKFEAAVPYFQVHALSYLLTVIPFDAVARARGDGKWIFRNLSVFAAISVGVTLGTVTSLGPMGVLVGMLGVHGVMRAVALRHIHVSEGWKLSKFLPGRALLRFTAISALLSVAAGLARPLFGGKDLIWFFVTSPVFFVAYIAATAEDLPARVRSKLRLRLVDRRSATA